MKDRSRKKRGKEFESSCICFINPDDVNTQPEAMEIVKAACVFWKICGDFFHVFFPFTLDAAVYSWVRTYLDSDTVFIFASIHHHNGFEIKKSR